jgi:3-methyladenine DNA glycosylase AlkD
VALAEVLRNDAHDLMHKAVGWLQREVGKRVDREKLRAFILAHAPELPRTMLRYAIEHFPPEERKAFLALKAPLTTTSPASGRRRVARIWRTPSF